MTKNIEKLLEAKNLLILGVLYTLFITIVFLSPTEGLPRIKLISHFDKIIHVFSYLIGAFIWVLYFYKRNNNYINRKTLFNIIIILFIYGIVIEALQELLIPSRQADILDVVANTTGILIGIIFFLKVKNRIKT